MKQWIASILCICMLISVFPAALAEEMEEPAAEELVFSVDTEEPAPDEWIPMEEPEVLPEEEPKEALPEESEQAPVPEEIPEPAPEETESEEEAEPIQEETEPEQTPAYPWDAMTDEEFAAYIRSESSREYLRGILNGADPAAKASFNARLGAVADEDLYFALVAVLAELVEEAAVPAEKAEEASDGEEINDFALRIESFIDGDTTSSGRLLNFLYQPENREPVSDSSSLMANNLNTNERLLYNAVKEMAASIAAGNWSDESSTEIMVSLPTKHYTAAELGVPTLVSNGYISREASLKMKALSGINFDKVLNAVLFDCPYETFWRSSAYRSGVYLSCNGSEIWFSGKIYLDISVSWEYNTTGEDFSFYPSPAKIRKTSGALTNARSIVRKYEGYSNLEKMRGYVNEICKLNTYNDYAASNRYPYSYGDPWGLIYVFDGDSSTNVVCEGYAKSFQYLCELSTFSGNVYAYSVSGDVIFSDGDGGPHMWNIVHMENGQNYHVDPTFCDGGSGTDNSRFFILPSRGSVSAGYTIGGDKYVYDSETLGCMTTSQLTLSSTAYKSGSSLSITSQPANQTVDAGTNATFRVSASGSGLKYQWQYLKPNGSWTNCTSTYKGYNTATLTVAASTTNNGWQFRCVVSDSSGRSVNSSAATLTIRSTLKITTQPRSVTVSENATATFTVAASGTGLKYQWQYKSPAAGADWVNCSSSTTGYNTATLKPVGTAARNGYQYRCVITDSSGSKVTSSAATLTVTVTSTAPRITRQPASVTVLPNATATFTVAASGTNLKYQWQYKNNVGGDWANCSSATAGYNTATLKPVGTLTRDGYQYRCKVTSGSSSVYSSAATLTVSSGLRIATNPVNASVYPNTTATFTVAASGTGLKYQWQYRNAPAGGGWANCSSATAGYNTATLRPVASLQRSGYQYRCRVTDSYGVSVTSTAATLNIINNLKFTRQPASQSAHAGTTAIFTVTASGSGLIYQWQYKSPSGSSWANCSAATAGYNTPTLKPSATMARNGYQYRCRVTDKYGVYILSDAAVLTVYNSLKVTRQPANQTVSTGRTATFSITAEGNGLTYQWEYRVSPTGKWANCSAATTGYNTATLKPVGTSGRNGYQYRCTVTDKYGNKVSSNFATLTVR